MAVNRNSGGQVDGQACFVLVLLPGTGNISQVKERRDSIKFQQNLEANITPSFKKLKMKKGWLLRQDDDPKHTSKSIGASCRFCHGLQSPDLNIIENLWIDLKRAVHSRPPKNRTKVEAFCKA